MYHRLTPVRVLREVDEELSNAISRFPAFNSPHEGKAVIEEELDELWEHVKANTGRSKEARQEALQVAAMALRYVLDLCSPGVPCFDHDKPDCPICLAVARANQAAEELRARRADEDFRWAS